ncbi:prefoldin subunit 1, putative [Paecilomyces variotii No. 5]|uniref:Prefoldin subunit 1, putative n=1 Tax=Byssochlamys spectabilis (strain No. 5 / NBRC 109023) TaxID=1356009 RepID=V5G460_BYSSN|nr:prefoldin subunit 1, putative [Paecilomyces variotii No. 5]
MSIPNEALQKLVQEIESRAIVSQQQLGLVKAQIGSKQRDIRLLELTSTELGALPKDTNVYEGVGKMFVATPISTVEKRLGSETTELKTDITDLEKKLHYLETTHKNSVDNIDQILKKAWVYLAGILSEANETSTPTHPSCYRDLSTCFLTLDCSWTNISATTRETPPSATVDIAEANLAIFERDSSALHICGQPYGGAF